MMNEKEKALHKKVYDIYIKRYTKEQLAHRAVSKMTFLGKQNFLEFIERVRRNYE